MPASTATTTPRPSATPAATPTHHRGPASAEHLDVEARVDARACPGPIVRTTSCVRATSVVSRASRIEAASGTGGASVPGVPDHVQAAMLRTNFTR